MAPGTLEAAGEADVGEADGVGIGTKVLGGVMAAWVLVQTGVLLRLRAFLDVHGADGPLGQDSIEAFALREALRPALRAEGLDGIVAWLYAPLSLSISTVLTVLAAGLVITSLRDHTTGRHRAAVVVVAILAGLVWVPPNVWPLEFAFANAISE